jgi:hypothetical protein
VKGRLLSHNPTSSGRRSRLRAKMPNHAEAECDLLAGGMLLPKERFPMRSQVKLTVVVLVVLLMAIAVMVVAAQPAPPEPAEPAAPAEPNLPASPPPIPPMMAPGLGMAPPAGMMGTCAPMMGAMMGRSAVAVTRDAVFVLAGNELIKYDRNLKPLKHARIMPDMARMGRMSQQMIESCPWMQPPGAGLGQGMGPGRGMMRRAQRTGMGMGMGMGAMAPLCGGMMGGMMGRASIAVERDGVYVLAGGELLRYDTNLNLKSKAEIPVDMAAHWGAMQQFMQNCPMWQQMQPPPQPAAPREPRAKATKPQATAPAPSQ